MEVHMVQTFIFWLFLELTRLGFLWMDQKRDRSKLTESVPSNDDSDVLNVMEKSLVKSIFRDDKVELIAQSKRLFQTFSEQESSGGRRGLESPTVLDRSIAAKLLQLCCTFDSAECAASLIAGEIWAVPLVNEADETGRSPLHTAAEMQSARCVELLLRKRARTDLKSKDGRAQLPLELSLFSRRLDVLWSPNDSIVDLLVLLSQKDLTAVRLLVEKKTKDATEVAYRSAMKGEVLPLAALLTVASEKINASILERVLDKGSSGSGPYRSW